VYIHKKTDIERIAYHEKLLEIQAQSDLFLPEYKDIEFRTHEIRLKWQCPAERCRCAQSPHDMQVLDWGLIELARKNSWNWELAKQKLEELSQVGTYDFRLILGNFKQYQRSFGVIALWYPKQGAQHQLL